MIRILLIVAIVAGLATAGVSFFFVKKKVTTLVTDRDTQKQQKETAQADAATSKRDAEQSRKELETTKTQLATTTDERDKAMADAAEQSKRAATLTENLTRTTQERDDAQNQLSQWKVLGVTPDQVNALKDQNKQLETTRTNLQARLADLGRDYRRATNELYKLRPDWQPPLLPETIRGQVVVVDPKYDFIVVNVGSKEGVLEDGILLVNRNGHLVAKVQVRSVQAERSIANVLPGWKLGEIMEGDTVLPTVVQ